MISLNYPNQLLCYAIYTARRDLWVLDKTKCSEDETKKSINSLGATWYLFIQKIRDGTGIRQIEIQKVRSRVAEILSSDTRVTILSSVTF